LLILSLVALTVPAVSDLIDEKQEQTRLIPSFENKTSSVSSVADDPDL